MADLLRGEEGNPFEKGFSSFPPLPPSAFPKLFIRPKHRTRPPATRHTSPTRLPLAQNSPYTKPAPAPHRLRTHPRQHPPHASALPPSHRHRKGRRTDKQTDKRADDRRQTTDDRRTDRGAAPYPAGGANLPRAPESGDASLATLCCHLTLCPRSRIRIFNRKLRACGQSPPDQKTPPTIAGRSPCAAAPGLPKQGTS